MFDFVKKFLGKRAIIESEQEEESLEVCKHEEAEVRRDIGQDPNPSFLVCKQCGVPYGRA